MGFEEKLADVIDKFLEAEGYDAIIGALRRQADALEEQEREALREV